MLTDGHAFGAESELTTEGTPCPYGYSHAHDIRFFLSGYCEGSAYQSALADGWRRSGNLFYQNACADGCAACIPIRIDAGRIAPRKTQRHTIRKNADLRFSADHAEFRDEDFSLFRKYLRVRHPEDSVDFDEAAYDRAYVRSPVETVIVRYRTADGRLVALSYLDILPDGLSSVYFAFDPEEEKRSLGNYSVFAESAIVRDLNRRWYYLGFWISECRKMAYKTDFRPFQLAMDGVWRDAGEIRGAEVGVQNDS